MNTYYRYEVYYNGEYEQIGLLYGLDEIVSEDVNREMMRPFNRALTVPDIRTIKKKNNIIDTESYFTEKGYLKFREHLYDIIDYVYGLKTGYEIKEKVIELANNDENIVYNDSLQIVLKTK